MLKRKKKFSSIYQSHHKLRFKHKRLIVKQNSTNTHRYFLRNSRSGRPRVPLCEDRNRFTLRSRIMLMFIIARSFHQTRRQHTHNQYPLMSGSFTMLYLRGRVRPRGWHAHATPGAVTASAVCSTAPFCEKESFIWFTSSELTTPCFIRIYILVIDKIFLFHALFQIPLLYLHFNLYLHNHSYPLSRGTS